MLLSLQRSHGNRFVQRLLDATVLQRDCGCGGTCADCSSKQPDQDHHSEPSGMHRHSAAEPVSSPVPPVVHEVLSSAGQPLDASTRAFMEPRFARDFQSVRIHTGTKASESAKAVRALAYTVGQDIVFAEGQYAPGSYRGQHLLAHELVHTVQQAGASRGPIAGISQPGDATEREADQVAERVMRMEEPPHMMSIEGPPEAVQECARDAASSVRLQRQGSDEHPQEEEELYEAGDQIMALPRWTIAKRASNFAESVSSGAPAVLQRAGCDSPVSMRKVTTGKFEGGKTLDDYYPDLVGAKMWGKNDTAGPFDSGNRAGSAVQLIAEYPSPCTSSGAGITISQTITWVKLRANGKKVAEKGKAIEGQTYDDIAHSGRDASKAPFRQQFSFAVSIADPISGVPYAGLDSYECEVKLTTTASGGGETKSVDWGITVEAAKGKVTKNEVR